MIFNYNECFWGDSTLEKIEIEMEYNIIVFTILNDALQKHIKIKCFQCVGMTQLIIWDENIIENVFFKEISSEQHQILTPIKQLYGANSYDAEKRIEGQFFELRILLINELSFSVICKNVSFED